MRARMKIKLVGDKKSAKTVKMRMRVVAGLFGAMFLSGCAINQAGLVKNKEYQHRILKLRKMVSQEKTTNRNLREENTVLRKLAGLTVETKDSSQLTPDTSNFQIKEKRLYTSFIVAFKRGDMTKVAQLGELLRNSYPKSRHADETLLFYGDMLLDRGQVGSAIQVYDQMLVQYPKSRKRASALLAKGRAYAQLNVSVNAKRYFEEVQTKFPGSPEAARAQLENQKLNR